MNYFYKVGGSLDENHPTYIKRHADKDLYENLLAGNFCYVLTSRQMGKSSLRVRVKKRLEEDGFRCSAIDLTEIGSHNITASQWYYGILDRLIVDLELTEVIDLDDLWAQYQNLSPLQRLNKFVDTILFAHTTTPIVIFVDEIDSIINLNFDTDDFFAWIRYCYNFRTDNLDYKRLTFCLLGVATPTDLIKNKSRTSYNIGESIEPLRFQENQLNPLMVGLQGNVIDIEKIQHEIHKWTGGQPLLTQRLCKLIQSDLERIELGQEEESIAKLVESKIIENWESQDKQSHLQTIRDRLLKDEDKAVSLLGLYQQILEGMESKKSIEVGGNLSEVMALRLTGLVVSEEGRLFVYNQIYQRVFSAAWVAQELAKLRPYAVSLRQWLVNREDRYLLTGQGFLDAQQWSLKRQLTREDSQYLAASQKLHTENFQAQAEEIINKAKKRATLFTKIGVSGLIASVIASGIAWFNLNERIWLNNLENATIQVKENYPVYNVSRIIMAIKTGRELQKKVENVRINNYPIYSPLINLQYVITTGWQEVNRFEFPQHKNRMGMSVDGQTIVTGDDRGNVSILRQDGSVISTFKGDLQYVAVSANGQTIVTGGEIVKVWRRDGSLISTFRSHAKYSMDLVGISADGQTIITGENRGNVKIWRQDGSLISTFKSDSSITAISVSADGQTIIIADVGSVQLFRRDGSLIHTLKLKLKNYRSYPTAVGISADGQTIICGDYSGNVYVLRRDSSIIFTSKIYQRSVNNVTINADGGTIIVSGDNTMKVLRKNSSIVSPLTAHDSVFGVAVSADGQTIFSSNGDKTVKIWRRDGFLITTLRGHEYGVNDVAVSANGKTIVSGDSDGNIKVWQRNGSSISNINSHQDVVSGVAVSADGQIIASASGQSGDFFSFSTEKVNLWRQDGSPISTLKSDQYSARHVRISADGNTIVTGNDDTVNLWQQDGYHLRTLKGHQNKVTSVGISSDGETIVSGSEDQTVKLWQRDGSLLKTLTGHQDEVSSVGISADGQVIVSGSKDKTVKVWRRDGFLITTLVGGGEVNEVRSVGISADGKTIVSGGEKTLRVWHFDLDYLLAKGCEQIEDYLNSHPTVNREDLCPTSLKRKITR